MMEDGEQVRLNGLLSKSSEKSCAVKRKWECSGGTRSTNRVEESFRPSMRFTGHPLPAVVSALYISNSVPTAANLQPSTIVARGRCTFPGGDIIADGVYGG
jgi:hypothetical protein